jgi:hypothetical protein
MALRSSRNPWGLVVTVLLIATVDFLIARVTATLGRPGVSTIPGKCVGYASRCAEASRQDAANGRRGEALNTVY